MPLGTEPLSGQPDNPDLQPLKLASNPCGEQTNLCHRACPFGNVAHEHWAFVYVVFEILAPEWRSLDLPFYA